MKNRMRVKRRTAEAAAVITQDPTVTSAQEGVYKVGVLLTSAPPVYTPTSARADPQWLNGSTEIAGATSPIFLPTTDLVGASLRCRWTVSTFRASATALSPVVGPILALTGGQDPEKPVDPQAAYEGVHADTLAARATLTSKFIDAWPGYQDETPATDQLCTSRADLVSKFNALPTDDLSQWHILNLDSTQPISAWEGRIDLFRASNANQTVTPGGVWDAGHYYGSWADRASAGGGVLIRSSDPNDPVTLYATASVADVFKAQGVRGLHLKDLKIANISSARTDTARNQSTCIRIVRTDKYRDAPVTRIENCKIGAQYHPNWSGSPLDNCNAFMQQGSMEQIDWINNTVRECFSGFRTAGCYRIRSWGNDYIGVLGDNEQHFHTFLMQQINSTFDEMIYGWFRLNTFRGLADSVDVASNHTDQRQLGTGADKGGYLVLEEFEASYLQRVVGTDSVRIDPNSVFVDGEYVTIDDKTYTARNTPTLATDFAPGVDLTEALTNLLAAIRLDPPTGMLDSLRSGGNYIEIAKPFDDVAQVSTNKAGLTTSDFRITHGTQAYHRNNSPHPISTVSINNIGVIGAVNALRMVNGNCIADRCTFARHGLRAPDATLAVSGFDSNLDALEPAVYGEVWGSNTADQMVRNSITSKILMGPTAIQIEADGVYTSTGLTITAVNNLYTAWRKDTLTNRVEDLLTGPFTRDASNQIVYDFPVATEGVSQAAFRQALYEILKPADPTVTIGVIDPSVWPTA